MDADCRDLLANERSEEEGGPGKEGAANLIWTNYFLLHHQQRKQEKLEQIGGKFEKVPIPSMQCHRSNLNQICFARKPPLITGSCCPSKAMEWGWGKCPKLRCVFFVAAGFLLLQSVGLFEQRTRQLTWHGESRNVGGGSFHLVCSNGGGQTVMQTISNWFKVIQSISKAIVLQPPQKAKL